MIADARRLLAPRVILGTVSAAFVALGAWWLSCHPPVPAQKPKPEIYLAVHAMPANYRLSKADMKPADQAQKDSTLPQYLGKYLVHDVPADQPVETANLRAKPVLSPSTGKDIFPFSLEGRPDLIETLNTGSKIDLYQNTQAVLKQVPVLAIQCDPPASTSCKVILDVTAEEKNKLSALELARITIFERKP